MLTLKNINVSFGHHHILKDISCTIEDGDFIIIVGGNGAGKSTFFDTIAGKIKPTSGALFFRHTDITQVSEIERSRFITRLFQNTYLNSVGILTVAQNLALSQYAHQTVSMQDGMNRMGEKKAIMLLEELGINPRLLHVRMNQLSGGQRQLISFVMATQLQPSILLLDEPTAALDPQAATNLLAYATAYIKKKKVTTFLITHDPHIALSIGNKIWILDNGRITKQFTAEQKKQLNPAELIGQIDYCALERI
jgi:putative ABC transport system ATP-binding protein